MTAHPEWAKRWKVLKPAYHRMLWETANATTDAEREAAREKYARLKNETLPENERQ